jgi:hypothetical protein
LAVDPAILPMTTVNYYRLGEADGAVTNAGTIAITKDSVGTNDLHGNNGALYSTNVSLATIDGTNKSLGMSVNGVNQSVSGAGLSPVTDNFCLEAWINPRSNSGANRVIAYNGLASTSGWGLFQSYNNVGAVYAGVAPIPNAVGVPLPTDTWTHVAIVQSNGVARFYTNGVLAGAPVSVAPKAPDGSGFGIGGDATASNPNVSRFDGLIDEVRFSTFAAGNFDERALMANAGPTPIVKTLGASSSGQLNASAFAAGIPATVYFEYGDTTNYGANSVTNLLTTNLNVLQPVAIQLSTPPNSASLHYRAVLDFGALGKITGDDAFSYLLKIREASIVTGALVIKASGTPGHSYQLQTATSLASPVNWQNVGTRISAAGDGGMQSTNSINGSPRFYRFSE